MKLSLNVESLKVETFVPAPDAASLRGTVQGQASGPISACVCPISAPYTGCTGCTCDEVCSF